MDLETSLLKFMDAVSGGYIKRDPEEKLTRFEFMMELLEGWDKLLKVAEERPHIPGNPEAATALNNARYILTKSYGLAELTKHSEGINDPQPSSTVDGAGFRRDSSEDVKSIPDATGDSRP